MTPQGDQYATIQPGARGKEYLGHDPLDQVMSAHESTGEARSQFAPPNMSPSPAGGFGQSGSGALGASDHQSSVMTIALSNVG